jgi:sarcosine oxidase subunit alpha
MTMSHTALPPAHHPIDATSHSADAVGRDVFFWFEGRRLKGRAGDSVAKSLFDNGIRILSHSVKYGRPRSIHCGRGRCTMCHVELDGVTGVKSCLTPLAEGMRIRRQHYQPFYGSFIKRAMRRLPLPAGFYYRMFTRPRLVRDIFVRAVRRMAGVGKINYTSNEPHLAPPFAPSLAALRERYDVVVIGAGVSGMSAALAAAEAGVDVLVVEEYAGPGGHSIGRGLDARAAASRDDLLKRLAISPKISVSTGTTAQGFYPPERLLLGHVDRDGRGDGLALVSASSLVLATGAQDVTPLFENNDLPGVFGARGLRLFLERDGLVPGRNAVVFGTGSSLQDTVRLLEAWGISVRAIVDARPVGSGGTTPLQTRERLVAAEGRDWVSSAVFENAGGDRWSVPCDLLCIAAPGQPAFELAQQAGFQFEFASGGAWPEGLEIMTPTADVLKIPSGSRVYLVGETAGRFETNAKIGHAADIGAAAARPD